MPIIDQSRLFPPYPKEATVASFFEDVQEIRESPKVPYEMDYTKIIVTKVKHYKGVGEVQHEILVVYFGIDNSENALLVERCLDFAGSARSSTLRVIESSALVSSSHRPAEDTITTLAKSEPLLVDNMDFIRQLTFRPLSQARSLTLLEFATMAHAVSRHAPNYSLYHRQCYWFADVLFNCLHDHFGGVREYGKGRAKQGKLGPIPILRAPSLGGVLKAFEDEWENVLKRRADRRREVEEMLDYKRRYLDAEQQRRSEQQLRQELEAQVKALQHQLSQNGSTTSG